MNRWRRLLQKRALVLLNTVAGVAIVLLGGFSVMEGAVSIGMLVAFQVLASSFNAPVASFVSIGAQLQETHGYADRIGDVMRQPVDPMLKKDRDARMLPKFAGGIEIDGALVRLFAGDAAAAGRCVGDDQARQPRRRGRRLGQRQVDARPRHRGAGSSCKAGEIRIDGAAARPDGQRRAAHHRGLRRPDHDAYFRVRSATHLRCGTFRPGGADRRARAKDAAIHDIISSRPSAYDIQARRERRQLQRRRAAAPRR